MRRKGAPANGQEAPQPPVLQSECRKAHPVEKAMRNSILVRRDSGSSSYLIGSDVQKILSSIEGVSAPRVEREYIDRADLSYESNDESQHLEKIDRILRTKGMYRL